MSVTLKFNMDTLDADDRQTLKHMTDGPKLWSAAHNFANSLRSIWKYSQDEKEVETAKKIRDIFYEEFGALLED